MFMQDDEEDALYYMYESQETIQGTAKRKDDANTPVQRMQSPVSDRLLPDKPGDDTAENKTEQEGTNPEQGDNTESPENSAPEAFSFFRITRQEKFLLCSLALVNFAVFMCLSVLAPFFPLEAKSKGVSSTVSGWIFGAFPLVGFITSPMFGKLLPVVGPSFMYLAGQFFAGGCTVLFGLLDYVPYIEDDGLMFVILCFVLRIFLALGSTAATTASWSITASTFPDSVSTVFGVLETFTGLGFMIGPALGGVLFQLGGFMLPFVSLGGFMILMVPFNWWILPVAANHSMSEEQNGSMLQLVRVPAIAVVLIATVVGALVLSILDPTLEPHLNKGSYDMDASIIGLIFLMTSAFYAISSPIFGWVADQLNETMPLLVIGSIFCGLGLFLLGPSPLLGLGPDYNELWLNLVALIIIGLASALFIIPTFNTIVRAANKAGMPDAASNGMVAGLWGSMYSLGDFLGPALGGWLVDLVGFPWCTTYIAGLAVFTAAVLFLMWLYEVNCGPCAAPSCGPCVAPVRGGTIRTESVVHISERTALLSGEPDSDENSVHANGRTITTESYT